MARRPGPVRPRVKDERAYNAALRRALLDPMFGRLRGRLHLLESLSAIYAATDGFFDGFEFDPEEIAAAHLGIIKAYHDRRFTTAFRSALGVDIRPLLTEPEVRRFMARAISDNVDLIRTIPPRAHDGLKARLDTVFTDRPFDQALVRKVLSKEYRASGYNLRRLTRDQTSKTVGKLTEIRQTQLGIQGYEWITAGDERVRPTHVDLSGQFFRWDSPPAEGHPGTPIQCRCTAIAALTNADRQRLKEAVGATQ